MQQNNPVAQNIIEQLAPGVTCEWLFDNRIVLMCSHDSTRTTVDAWINRAIEIVREWPANKPFLVAIDASDPAVTRTPYSRARLKDLTSLRPELKWCIALIPPKTHLMQLMRLGLKLRPRNHEIEIFFDRPKAVDWLKSKA